MDYIITHYPDKKRFETQVDGVTAFVQYRLSGDKLDIIHTIVPPVTSASRLRRIRCSVFDLYSQYSC